MHSEWSSCGPAAVVCMAMHMATSVVSPVPSSPPTLLSTTPERLQGVSLFFFLLLTHPLIVFLPSHLYISLFIPDRVTPSSFSRLLFNFFEMFAHWDWRNKISLTGEDFTVCIIPFPSLTSPHYFFFLHFSLFSFPSPPIQDGSRSPMWILTPAHPMQNSIHNGNESTFRVLKNEFARGYKICTDIQEQFQLRSLFPNNLFFSSAHLSPSLQHC